MYKRLAFILTMVFVLGFTVSALAAPPFTAKWTINTMVIYNNLDKKPHLLYWQIH
jgi:hypothetical protein